MTLFQAAGNLHDRFIDYSSQSGKLGTAGVIRCTPLQFQLVTGANNAGAEHAGLKKASLGFLMLILATTAE